MKCATFVALVGLAALARAPADPPKVSPRADALDLVLLTADGPVRLELRAAIDGKSIPAIWDETFAKLFAFHDRNGDGALDKAEAARLPAAFVLRQVLWGQVTPATGGGPAWADLDLDGDGKVRPDELSDCYRRAGLGGVLVGAGKPPGTDRLTDALVKHLDASADGKVDEAEWKRAAEVLLKLDKNDDELIGPGELVEKLAYPGASGAVMLSPPHPDARSDALADALPLAVLPLRTADARWRDPLAARLKVEPDALAPLRTNPARAVWEVRFGAKDVTLDAAPTAGKTATGNGRLRIVAVAALPAAALAAVRLELRADSGKLPEQAAAARKRFAALFVECDANGDAALDAKELGAAKAATFATLLPTADRDADGRLGEAELTAWLDLEDQVARGHILLTVLDHGRGLYEVLDADRDGALSVRELRTAWGRLGECGCVSGGAFDRAKLPRHLLATVSRGHPRAALGGAPRGGPEWFRAMDRNGDGDVSKREFTGPIDVFDKLDLDRDGLLSAEEAATADVKKK